MATRQRRHDQGRHLQPAAQRTRAAASADPEASGQRSLAHDVREMLFEMLSEQELAEKELQLQNQRIKNELVERRSELLRRHRCTALRRCIDHSALVKQEAGVSIDDPAFKELAGLARAVPAARASDAELVAWMRDTSAYLSEDAKRLDAIAETAPDDVNVPSIRDGGRIRRGSLPARRRWPHPEA